MRVLESVVAIGLRERSIQQQCCYVELSTDSVTRTVLVAATELSV